MQANNNRIIKGLLLDLDNTLYLYEPAHEAGLKSVFITLAQITKLTVEELTVPYEQAKSQVKRRLLSTAASHHRLLYLQTMLEQLNIFSPTLTKKLHEEYWAAFLPAMQPIPGMSEALHALAKTLSIGIITNFVADIQYRKLEQLGIDNIVTHLVTSEEMGCEKPDPKIFHAACKKMQLRPEELCMIGDDLAADIIPARNLGMETLWLVPETDTTKPEHSLFKTCSNFFDLEKRLQ
jgi:HAD superfamily hydrolase (TIGR01509 family)